MTTDPNAWTDASVIALRDLSPTVREFELLPAGGVRPWAAGSHLRVQVVAAAGRLEDRRYSLVGLPSSTDGKAAGGSYRIAVKRVPASRGGSAFMWRLKVGDRLPLQHPQNHFELPLHAAQTLLLAGGIGITAMLGMAQALAARRADVQMRYAVRAAEDRVYDAELRAALGPRLRTLVSQHGERLDLDAEIAALHPQAQMLVCGPLTLLNAAREAWACAGRPAQRLRFETFGSSGAWPAAGFTVSVPRHGLALAVPADRSLLDVLQEHGVQVLAECRRGECGLCTVDVLALDGTIDHRDVFLSARERSEGTRLCACVSRVAGGGTLVIDSAYRPD